MKVTGTCDIELGKYQVVNVQNENDIIKIALHVLLEVFDAAGR